MSPYPHVAEPTSRLMVHLQHEASTAQQDVLPLYIDREVYYRQACFQEVHDLPQASHVVLACDKMAYKL